jgi:UDP-glucose 4-epimerase
MTCCATGAVCGSVNASTMGRRVLITGLASFWGGRLAQALERDPDVDVIIGLDTREPTLPLERTEFVRTDQNYSILARIVRATQVDTILHTFLVVDSTHETSSRLHEINVIGTMNLLAASGAADSSVRHIVVKSSGLVYGASWQDPNWFREEMVRVAPAKSRVERSLVEVESYLRDFAEDNPHVLVTLLRFANVLGTDIVTPITRALQLPAVPSIFGFDPLVQFIEEDDVVRSIEFAMRNEVPGVFNVTGDGRLPWSEVASICGKRLAPMSPILTEWAAGPLSRLGVNLPPELLDLMRYGRGLDNRRLKQAGFRYRYTSAGAVKNFAEALRLQRAVGDRNPQYRYEPDVEAFFRHSAAVVRETSQP